MSQQWKQDERDVCRMCGSERSGPVGREGPDCDKAAPWAIQVKRCPKPALKAKWLAQAKRDADHRPWVLVQVWYRPGRPRIYLATCGLDLLAAYSNPAFWGVTLRQYGSRPSLTKRDLEGLLHAKDQPWLLIHVQRRGDPAPIATCDYRVLCELGKRAGAVPDHRAERS